VYATLFPVVYLYVILNAPKDRKPLIPSQNMEKPLGLFFGLKLHIVTNDLGELLAFKITRGSRSDSQEAVPLLKGFKGLAFGDKGYLCKKFCKAV
jgi:hypothetical protein